MNHDRCVFSLQQLLAQAVVLGTTLSSNECRGVLWNPSNRELWENLQKLRQYAAEFLSASELKSIELERLLPLHDEMQNLIESGASQ